jgi:hypothetical protein
MAMLGYKKPLTMGMIGHKRYLGQNLVGHKMPMEHLAKIHSVTRDLAERKKMNGLEKSRRKEGSLSLGQYA